MFGPKLRQLHITSWGMSSCSFIRRVCVRLVFFLSCMSIQSPGKASWACRFLQGKVFTHRLHPVPSCRTIFINIFKLLHKVIYSILLIVWMSARSVVMSHCSFQIQLTLEQWRFEIRASNSMQIFFSQFLSCFPSAAESPWVQRADSVPSSTPFYTGDLSTHRLWYPQGVLERSPMDTQERLTFWGVGS